MKGMNLKISKNRNAVIIDLVFGLMFDTLWFSPYDRRRQEDAFVCFEQSARRMAMELRALNTVELSEKRCEEVNRVAAELSASVERLRKEGIVSPEVGIRASEQVQQLVDILETALTDAGTPNK